MKKLCLSTKKLMPIKLAVLQRGGYWCLRASGPCKGLCANANLALLCSERRPVDVTWTGGSAGTFLDTLALAGRPAVQGSGVGATPAPLLPPPTADSTAGRPCGPRGPATVHCSCAQCKGEGETNTASQDYPTSTRMINSHKHELCA